MQEYSYIQDLALLEEAVRKAGAIALEYFGRDVKTWLKNDTSPVSEADMAVNVFLENMLLSARPSYGWISEESEAEAVGMLEEEPLRSFIVDPIDGTRGFLANDPHWCVSVAIAQANEIIVAAVFCPALGEFYSSTKERSLYCAEQKILAPSANPAYVIVAPYNLQQSIAHGVKQKIVFYKHQASLAYSIILCSRAIVDCIVIRPSCKEWDIAAADLILHNSGGVLYTHEGKAVTYRLAHCYSGYLFACRNREQFFNLALEINKIIG